MNTADIVSIASSNVESHYAKSFVTSNYTAFPLNLLLHLIVFNLEKSMKMNPFFIISNAQIIFLLWQEQKIVQYIHYSDFNCARMMPIFVVGC